MTGFPAGPKGSPPPGRILADHRGAGSATVVAEHKEGDLFMQDEVYPKARELSPQRDYCREGGDMTSMSDEGSAEVTDLYEAAYLVVKGLKVSSPMVNCRN